MLRAHTVDAQLLQSVVRMPERARETLDSAVAEATVEVEVERPNGLITINRRNATGMYQQEKCVVVSSKYCKE